MKEITIQDCDNLRERFDEYTKTAEQHEFPILFIVDMRLRNTLNHYHKLGSIEDQKEARAMFRSVLKVIGEDFSEYEEA